MICDVMGLADLCGLDGLKTLCENILKHSVDHENVCSILRNADRYQVRDEWDRGSGTRCVGCDNWHMFRLST